MMFLMVLVLLTIYLLIDYLDDDEIIKIINKWNEHARANKTILVYIFTKWDYKPELVDDIKPVLIGLLV